MKKFLKSGAFAAMLFAVCALALAACGKNGAQEDGAIDSKELSAISVKKDGTVEGRIVEDFGEDYYDEAGLKAMIDEAISEYSAESLSSEITLKSCKASDGKIIVEMEYGDYKAYAGFNSENFFAGTIKDAYTAGYDLDYTLSSAAADKAEVISKQDILNMGENHIIIFERIADDDEPITSPLRINCFDEILYVSEGVTAVSKKSANYTLSEGMGVIVFK